MSRSDQTPSEPHRPRISVVLAACNGERFLVEQVVSILPQLRSSDELILSVDPSTDATLHLARALAEAKAAEPASPGITVLEGPGRGVAANFEQALRAASGQIIFLADQDDLWFEDKVACVLEAFAASNALLVCHDAAIVAEDLALLEPSYFSWRRSRPGFAANILRNSYIGCCLALHRELLSTALPFPKGIPMHDQWLGLTAERSTQKQSHLQNPENPRHGGVLFLDKPLILYRRHSTNATASSHASFAQMLVWRLRLLGALAKKSDPRAYPQKARKVG